MNATVPAQERLAALRAAEPELRRIVGGEWEHLRGQWDALLGSHRVATNEHDFVEAQLLALFLDHPRARDRLLLALDGRRKIAVLVAHPPGAAAAADAVRAYLVEHVRGVDAQVVEPGPDWAALAPATLPAASYVAVLGGPEPPAPWLDGARAGNHVTVSLDESGRWADGHMAGVDELARFLRAELASSDTRERGATPTEVLVGASRREIRLVSRNCLGDDELRCFLWDRQLPASTLSSPTLQGRVLDLLHLVDGSGLEAFVRWLERENGECVRRCIEALRAGDVGVAHPASQATSLPSGSGGPIDMVVLVALEEEFVQFCELAPARTETADPDHGGYDYLFRGGPPAAPYQCVARLVGNMGPERAGLFADRLIHRWRPESLVMLGIAGALHPDLRLGDVAVAEQVSAYLAETRAVSRGKRSFVLQPRPRTFACDHAVLQEVANLRFAHPASHAGWVGSARAELEAQLGARARKTLSDAELIRDAPEIHRVHLASGPAVVTATAFSDWLRTQDATVKAAEMEAAGLVEAAATRRHPPRTIVIRGISDLADDRKGELDRIGKGGIRRLAMRNATHLYFALLDAGLLPRAGSSR